MGKSREIRDLVYEDCILTPVKTAVETSFLFSCRLKVRRHMKAEIKDKSLATAKKNTRPKNNTTSSTTCPVLAMICNEKHCFLEKGPGLT